jgi:hypothetical protein
MSKSPRSNFAMQRFKNMPEEQRQKLKRAHQTFYWPIARRTTKRSAKQQNAGKIWTLKKNNVSVKILKNSAGLDKDKRQKMRDRLKKFNSLSPEQKQGLRQRLRSSRN